MFYVLFILAQEAFLYFILYCKQLQQLNTHSCCNELDVTHFKFYFLKNVIENCTF